MSSDGNSTGVVGDPQGGFQLGKELTDTVAVGLDSLIDILVSFFRVYLITTTSILIPILLMFIVSYYIGLWPSSYGSKMMLNRIQRSATGLFIISIILPVLYLSMWIFTGSESQDGRAANLPSSGVFGTSFEERVIGPDPASGGLEIIDILVSFFQAYLITTTSVLIPILLILTVSYYMGLWPSTSESGTILKRIKRSTTGLFVVSIILPLLYIPMWFLTGTESHDGRAADLPSDGVFGTSFEERVIGPDPASGGLGMIADIFVSIFYTYQVTITFLLISLLAFATMLLIAFKWPPEVDPLVRRNRVYRILLGGVASLSIVPILHAISWMATGLYAPDQSFTRVSPKVALPYEKLFGGSQHPFLEQLAAESDPLQVTLQNILTLHVETLLFLGILAIVFGVISSLVLERMDYIQINFGRRSVQGGIIIVTIVLLIPAILSTGVWVATGSTGDIDITEGPPGHTSQCQGFQKADMGPWSTSSGDIQPQPGDWTVKLDGTIERKVSSASYTDGVIEITPAEGSSGEHEFQVQVYDGDKLLLDRTTQRSASYTFSTDGAKTIKISSDGGELAEVCTGFQAVALPAIALQMNTPDEVILRDGVVIDYTVTNVGHVPTGQEFDIGIYTVGTGFLGNKTEASQIQTQEPLSGGQFRRERVTATSLVEARSVGEVEIVVEVDPDGEMSQRTTVPSRASRTVDVVYANLEGSINADDVRRGNQTELKTSVVNNGTAYSSETSSKVNIYDSSGSTIQTWSPNISELDPQASNEGSFNHNFRTPGNYTARINVSDTLFPEGSTDKVSFKIVAPDLRGEIVDLDEEFELGDTTEFGIVVKNTGNLNMDGPTTAKINIQNSQGTTVDEQVVDIPALSAGETHETRINSTIDYGGVHTISLDVRDPDFPYGTQDSAQTIGLGPISPDLEVNATATQTEVYGLQTNIDTQVANVGSKPSHSTTGELTVFNAANGSTVSSSQISVRSIEPGSQQERTVPVNFSEPGVYRVEFDVDNGPYSDGTTDFTQNITVYESDLSLNLSSNKSKIPPGTTAGVQAVINNRGNYASDQYDVQVEFVNQRGSSVAVKNGTLDSIMPGKSGEISFESTLTDVGNHNAIAHLDVTEAKTLTDSTEIDVDLSVQSEPVEDQIPPGETAVVNATISNPGMAQSGEYNATAEFIGPDGSVVSTKSTTVAEIQPKSNQTVQFGSVLSDVGVHDIFVTVDTKGKNKPQERVSVQVVQSDIRGQVYADDVLPGSSTNIVVELENGGTATSSKANVTAVLRDPSGSTVTTEKITVSPLEVGESHSEPALETEVNTVGTYSAEIMIKFAGKEKNINSQSSFKVGYSNLTTSISGDDVTQVNEGDVQITISNDGTVQSDATSAEANITAPSGSLIKSVEFDVPALAGGESHTENIKFNTSEEGDHNISASISNTEQPKGATAQESIYISWPNLHGSIEADSAVISGNTTTLNAKIENVGPGDSESTTATIDILNSSEEVVQSRSIDVQSIPSGESSTVVINQELAQTGSYTGRIQVQDPELPGGNTDVTEEFEVNHGHPQGGIEFKDDTTAAETETDLDVTIQNTGNDGTEPTTADVRVTNSTGSTVFATEMDVDALEEGESQTESFSLFLNTSGSATAYVNVSSSEFPVGTTDEDDIKVTSPDLRAELAIEDVKLGQYTTVTIEVSNAGEIPANATTGELLIYNENMRRVVRRQISVKRLESDESTVIELSQLIAEECWRTEMSCVPGAQLGGSGTFTGEIDIVTEFDPEGSEDSDTFAVTDN